MPNVESSYNHLCYLELCTGPSYSLLCQGQQETKEGVCQLLHQLSADTVARVQHHCCHLERTVGFTSKTPSVDGQTCGFDVGAIILPFLFRDIGSTWCAYLPHLVATYKSLYHYPGFIALLSLGIVSILGPLDCYLWRVLVLASSRGVVAP